MLIKNYLVLPAERAIEQVAYQFLTRFAVHCLTTSVGATGFNSHCPGDYGTTSSGFSQSRGDCIQSWFKTLGKPDKQTNRRSEPKNTLRSYSFVFCCLSNPRNFIRALCSCDFDVPTEHPSIRA